MRLFYGKMTLQHFIFLCGSKGRGFKILFKRKGEGESNTGHKILWERLRRYKGKGETPQFLMKGRDIFYFPKNCPFFFCRRTFAAQNTLVSCAE